MNLILFNSSACLLLHKGVKYRLDYIYKDYCSIENFKVSFIRASRSTFIFYRLTIQSTSFSIKPHLKNRKYFFKFLNTKKNIQSFIYKRKHFKLIFKKY